jgi:hypothetical protein
MTDSPGLPPFDFSEPHGYAVMLSYVSCNDVSEEDYSTFLEGLTENPEVWPPLQELQADLGRHLPTNLVKPFAGNQKTVTFAPAEYQGRRVTREGVALVDCWHVIVVSQPDGTWRIRGYTRDSASYKQLQAEAEREAAGN